MRQLSEKLRDAATRASGEAHSMLLEAADHIDPVELKPKACAICGSLYQVKTANRALTGWDGLWCFHCFEAWYDGGKTTGDEIRAHSLKSQGRAGA